MPPALSMYPRYELANKIDAKKLNTFYFTSSAHDIILLFKKSTHINNINKQTKQEQKQKQQQQQKPDM